MPLINKALLLEPLNYFIVLVIVMTGILVLNLFFPPVSNPENV